MNNEKDAALIKGFLSGNNIIIEAFYQKKFPVIKSYIIKNSGTENEAKDIFQDALVLTYQKLKSDSLNLECSLATYIFAVSRNMWMNTLRRRRKILSWDKIPDVSDSMNVSILDHIHECHKHVLYKKYFLNLGDTCKQLLNHFFLEKSMTEISKLMGYSVGYTRKKKFECKKRLIELLEADPIYAELKHESSKEKES